MKIEGKLWPVCGLYAVLWVCVTGLAAWRMPLFYSVAGVSFGIFFVSDFLIWRQYCRIRKRESRPVGARASMVHFFSLLPVLLLVVLLCFRDLYQWPAFWRTYLLGGIAVLYLLKILFAVLWFMMRRKAEWVPFLLVFCVFLTLLYAMVISTFNVRIDKVDMRRANPERPVPAGLRGYRILQISDLHIGSFTSVKQIRRLVSQALQTQPDMVVFTGDMVNFSSAEVDPFVCELMHLQAPDGVYCILGNHDYGGYVAWKDTAARHADMQKLLQHYRRLNWTCLNNAAVKIERGGDTLLLAGVENWGKGKRFPKKGDLAVALAPASLIEKRPSRSLPPVAAAVSEGDGSGKLPRIYTVLLSHDPSHFDSVVYLRYPQVDLTLSGHTHGMQMGVRINGRDYSPARWVYEHYSGLYRMANGQALYVNTGCGFNGIPFRLGIRPSLTLFQF